MKINITMNKKDLNIIKNEDIEKFITKLDEIPYIDYEIKSIDNKKHISINVNYRLISNIKMSFDDLSLLDKLVFVKALSDIDKLVK